VPIRSKERIVGLIQLNDRAKGRFTLERIEVLEGVAAQIGEALMRKRMEAALREGEQKLREYQEELQGMAFDAAVVQERERRRIAVDLHDSIGQVLALAQIKLTALREDVKGAPRVTVDEVVKLLSQAIIDSRALVFALSPPVLYDLGLSAAISWLIEDVEAKHGMHVALTADSEDQPLDETTAVIVFRAVRELLMNVLKHAKSPSANVRLRRAGDHLEVVVEDAGVGFDSEAATSAARGGSFGLFSLREQIGRLGGTVEITSAKGKGTTACVRVPSTPGTAARRESTRPAG
jgi:signal transduction histidine kinase